MTGTDFLLGRGAGIYINQEGNKKVTLRWLNPCSPCWTWQCSGTESLGASHPAARSSTCLDIAAGRSTASSLGVVSAGETWSCWRTSGAGPQNDARDGSPPCEDRLRTGAVQLGQGRAPAVGL